jgi:hypothetical protein
MTEEAANTGKKTLMSIMNEKRAKFNETSATETAIAAEIAERICLEALESITEIEQENFEKGEPHILNKSVPITESDYSRVRMPTQNRYSDGRKTGSQIVKEQAEIFIQKANAEEGEFKFSYTDKECCDNQFKILVEKK